MNIIKQGQRWQYLGNDDTRGLVHTVVGVSPDEIVTWSDPVQRAAVGGFTWLGPQNAFLQNFKQLTEK